MNQTPIHTLFQTRILSGRYATYLRSLFAGLLIPCGFAPIHIPGLALLGLALLFAQLRHQTLKQSFYTGFIFGLGFFGLGVSWVYVSIHTYGHLNPILSAFITLVFVGYLALFPALVCLIYQKLATPSSRLLNCFLFSAIWCLMEAFRATFMTGFPWLLLGVGQFDTPLKYLLPIVGIYGVSFFACLASTYLAMSVHVHRDKRYPWIIAFVSLLLAPLLLKNHPWSTTHTPAISTSVIQANVSMRDKWDEQLFWDILQRYEHEANQLIGHQQLIVMPESAIPLPLNYVSDFLGNLDQRAKNENTAILLGIPQATAFDDNAYYNTASTLGNAQGSYVKQHLVPFGEFIPKLFQPLSQWLAIPAANMRSGKPKQSLITIQNHSIANLICFEVAFPQLLRKQLPEAEWIVSISDDGWFGHSLAVYQQLQMSQVLSMQTGRYQIVSNNDGLSSIIDNLGEIVDSLPVFSSGVLKGSIMPATGSTPWVYLSDWPVFLICLLIMFIRGFVGFRSNKPT